MSGYVVVDASVALKWVIDENQSGTARALARSWIDLQLQPVAPFLWAAELTNGLFRMVAHARISLDSALPLLTSLFDADVQLLEPPDLHTRAMKLAAELRQPAAYDAHYLALAEILDCELWTADERFFRAASNTFGRLRRLGDFRPT